MSERPLFADDAPLTASDLEAGLTPNGTRPLTYAQLVELLECCAQQRCVLQHVEAYEPNGPVRYARLDASFGYPHEEYTADPHETVRLSIAFGRLMLDETQDREGLIYQVWLDKL